MRSKNKPAPTKVEGNYIRWVKDQSCVVCNAPGPSDCHEANQGQWFTSMPLCKDCHQGSRNGIHGEKRMWILTKMDEWSAVNETVRRFATEFHR